MKERKSTAKRWTLAVLIIFALVALIGGTYARYSTSMVANAKMDIAKWQIAMKAGTTELSTSEAKDVTFTVQNNTNVVSGKIAPSVTATATVEVDLTGTEVAVDLLAKVGATDPSTLPSKDKITLTTQVNGGTSTIPLEGDTAFTSANGKKNVVLTLTWENDDENNENDTATGVAGGTITVPVTLTAKQHIDAPAQQNPEP